MQSTLPYDNIFQTYNKLKSYATELDSHSLSGVCKGEFPNTLIQYWVCELGELHVNSDELFYLV